MDSKERTPQIALLPKPNPKTYALTAKGVDESSLGLASTQDGDLEPAQDPSLEVRDPLEGLNRFYFGINRGLDTVLIRPLSKIYGVVVPGPIRLGVRNIFNHLELPGDMINYALQGDGRNAGRSFQRLFLNTTVGLGGFFDAADHIGIEYRPTDFGLTLDRWGFREGIYLVSPLLGPGTTRDSIGRIVDIALLPTTYIGIITDFGAGGAIARGVDVVDTRHRNGELLDNVIFASPDPYVTLRSTYIQRRRALGSMDLLGGGAEVLPEIETAGQ